MRIVYTIVVVFIMLFIITFSLQNTSVVPLKYYNIIDERLPAYMLMFVAFLAGVIFTGLMGFIERLNLTKKIRELNKTIRDLRRELRATETFPIEDEKNDLPL
ncbi:MAG: LapA family protein [Syntrophales bacterium]|nr:LapA family protein [Syntrophales bacterium]